MFSVGFPWDFFDAGVFVVKMVPVVVELLLEVVSLYKRGSVLFQSIGTESLSEYCE